MNLERKANSMKKKKNLIAFWQFETICLGWQSPLYCCVPGLAWAGCCQVTLALKPVCSCRNGLCAGRGAQSRIQRGRRPLCKQLGSGLFAALPWAPCCGPACHPSAPGPHKTSWPGGPSFHSACAAKYTFIQKHSHKSHMVGADVAKTVVWAKQKGNPCPGAAALILSGVLGRGLAARPCLVHQRRSWPPQHPDLLWSHFTNSSC